MLIGLSSSPRLPFFLFCALSMISLVRDGLTLGDKMQITLPMVLTAAACAFLLPSLPGTPLWDTLRATQRRRGDQSSECILHSFCSEICL